jgi:hypothetical protein
VTHTVSPEGDVASDLDDSADHGQDRLLLDCDIRRVLPVTVAAIGLLTWGLGVWLGLVGLFLRCELRQTIKPGCDLRAKACVL